jgi:hypothetical protein
MSPFKMARLHLQRNPGQSFILFISLCLALTAASVLLQLYSINADRFSRLATRNVEAIVGPKSGGVEILLAALDSAESQGDSEKKSALVLPANLFETLKNGADLHFEDGQTISSKNLTEAVAPLAFAGLSSGFSVYGTTESITPFLGLVRPLTFPAGNGAWIGSSVASKLALTVGQSFSWNWVDGAREDLQVQGILPEQNSAWDERILIPLQKVWDWRLQKNHLHPVWREKVLSFILIHWQSQVSAKSVAALRSLLNDRSVSQMVLVSEEQQKLREWTGSVQGLGLAIVLVIGLLAAVAILGMWMIRVDSLRVSMATLRAVGYPGAYVLKWLVAEAVYLGLTAGLLAFVLDWVVMEFLGRLWEGSFIPRNHQFAFFVVGGGVLLSLVATAWPLWRISRASIHNELKSG